MNENCVWVVLWLDTRDQRGQGCSASLFRVVRIPARGDGCCVAAKMGVDATMNLIQLFSEADRIAREERISRSDALARLGRRGAEKRARNYGRAKVDRGVSGQLDAGKFWYLQDR